MAFCGNSSIWAKIAFVVIIIGLVLQIVGIATISWMVYQITTSSIRVGLWKMKSCTSTACSESEIPVSMKDANFNATQGLEIMVVIMFALCAIVIGVYCFLESARQNWLATTAIIMCFLTAFFGFIGMICWLVYIPDPYVVSYSLGLTVIACFLAWIAGLLLFPDVLGGKSHPRRQISPSKRRFMM